MILSFPRAVLANRSYGSDNPNLSVELTLETPVAVDLRAIEIPDARMFEVTSFVIGEDEYVAQPADADAFMRLFPQVHFRAVKQGEKISIRVRNLMPTFQTFAASIACVRMP